jgi:adenylate cyclase
VKGKNEAIEVYELIAARAAATAHQLDLVDRFAAARAAYLQRNWEQATTLFQSLADEYHDPVSGVYLERIAGFINNPPAEDWDGTYIAIEK